MKGKSERYGETKGGNEKTERGKRERESERERVRERDIYFFLSSIHYY